jgi:hypothetical protein
MGTALLEGKLNCIVYFISTGDSWISGQLQLHRIIRLIYTINARIFNDYYPALVCL